MKVKLILLYEMLLNSYFYYLKKDKETSKNYAYQGIRNLIGVFIFMLFLVFFVSIIGYFQINLDLKGKRPILYLIMGGGVISFLSISKKYLKPLFDNIEIKKEKPKKNYLYLFVVAGGLFGGGMFVIARLITIYFSLKYK